VVQPLVSDALWELVEPLIPVVPRRHRFAGCKRLDDRKVLTGILFVLQTGIPWEYLPQEMGCGSGMTCWRRLREWQEAGVWQRLHELLLAKLNEADRIDRSRAAIDSSHVRAFGGRQNQPESGRPRTQRLEAPPDRLRARHAARDLAHRRQPQRHHPDAAARGRDPARARPARAPRRRPRKLFGDRAYHSRRDRAAHRLARLRVLECVVGRTLRDAERLRGDARPRAVEDAHRDLEPLALRAEQVPGGDAAVVEGGLTRR
jgi:transposase